MEIWDIYDINRAKTGRNTCRGMLLNDGEFHLVVHACLFNREEKMLIQQRQLNKSPWAGLWDISVGGNAVEGESSEEAIKRETFEEISYEITGGIIMPSLTLYSKRRIEDFYIFKDDVNICDLKLQTQEVKAVRWASNKYIKKLQATDSFVPYRKNFIELLFEMSKDIL